MKDKEKKYISMREMQIEKSIDTITNCRHFKEGAFVDLLNQEIKKLEKEKQIEEISYLISNYYHNGSFVVKGSLSEMIYDKLFPKDSVMITKEEYNDYINLKELLDKGYFTSDNRVAIHKAKKETAKNILTKLQPYIGGWVLFKDLENEYGIEVEIKE